MMKTLTLAPRKKSVPVRTERRPAAPPIKLFYRIQEVADMTGLKPSVLRYWESEFRELSPEKDAADQRRYRPSDVEVVKAIRKLLYEDRFTIKGARSRLREELRRRREPVQIVEVRAPQKTKTAAVARISSRQTVPLYQEDFVSEASNGASATAVLCDSRPSVTEFRTRRRVEQGPDPAARRIRQNLRSLRQEVNALLNMLA